MNKILSFYSVVINIIIVYLNNTIENSFTVVGEPLAELAAQDEEDTKRVSELLLLFSPALVIVRIALVC